MFLHFKETTGSWQQGEKQGNNYSSKCIIESTERGKLAMGVRFTLQTVSDPERKCPRTVSAFHKKQELLKIIQQIPRTHS